MSTAGMIRVVAMGAIASLSLTGCGQVPKAKTVAAPAGPMISQAQAAAVMRNYDTVNNRANVRRDSKLLATIEDGDLLAQGAGTLSLRTRRRDTAYQPVTHSEPISFAAVPRGYPRAFFMYSTSSSAKRNAFTVFRKSDAAAPWKGVISGASQTPLPPIAVDTSGLATIVAPTASGYAVKPVDVAPLLAQALRSAKTPATAKFAPSPSLNSYHMVDATERAAAKDTSHIKATLAFTPTKDIYALKTKDGGLLVTGGMDWQLALSVPGGSKIYPGKGDIEYVLHPGPYSSSSADYKMMWAVQVPVKGLLKLVVWDGDWVNYSAS